MAHIPRQEGGRSAGSRRRFLAALGAVPLMGLGLRAEPSDPPEPAPPLSRGRVRGLLISATTLPGRGSLEHARESLAELFSGCRRLLLINFASLPADRDAYARRMQRDFAQIDRRLVVDSLHHAPKAEAAEAIRSAEAVYVSGGNTFLLLRELYDRSVVELLRERVLNGMPYAGSSAGSNIAGTVIGTTNDFPLVDIPTRRSLGILPAVFNPHHPDRSDEAAFAGRQGKIHQYARYHPEEIVLGVTDPGLVRIDGEQLSVAGDGGMAVARLGENVVEIVDHQPGKLSAAFAELRAAQSGDR